MNKKLIALAVAGACVAPTVMAQSANPITLYGALRMDVEYVEADSGPAGTPDLDGRTRMTDHPSLIGVRGSEDLGGGLKAWFQLETAFTADEATGAFANRNSGVGLQGGWGSVLIGRWDMPMKSAIGATDLWGDINKADYTAATMDQGNFSSRFANVVQYWSPNWSGFSFRLAYVPDEARASNATPTQTGASLTYSKGPLYIAYAYEEHKDSGPGQASKPNNKEEGNTIGATWTIGNFKLAGHYGEYKKTGVAKDKSYYVGGQYTMGKHVFLVTYQNADEGENAECDVLGAGYQYVFSKRTNVMFSYAEINNDAASFCKFGAGQAFGSRGQDLKGFGVGIRHYF